MSNESNHIEPKPICIIPNCGKEARWKGICSQCYGQASQLIKEDKTTWEQLAALGLATIPDKPFIAAFRKATLPGSP